MENQTENGLLNADIEASRERRLSYQIMGIY